MADETREFSVSKSRRMMLRRSAVAAVWEMDSYGCHDGPVVGVHVNNVTFEIYAAYEDVRDWIAGDG